MPGLSTNSTMGSASVPANGSNNLSSEYIYDQGLSCPFTDGYAYYTGFEPPVEWNEHINYFWVDDQNSQLSNENLPYVYCTPGYGFSYSSQDQYSYMPGMFMGVDGSFVGSQQYFAGPYQPSGSPSGYFPLLIQPTTGLSSTVALDPPVFSSGTSVASRPVNTSVQNQHKISGNTTHTSQTVPSGSPAIGASQHAYQHQSTNKSSDLPGANVTRRDKPSTSGSPVVGPSQHAYQNQSTNKPSDLPGANVARHDKPSTSHLTFPIDASSTGKNFQVTSGAWSSEDRGPRTDKPELASHATVAGEDGQTRAVSSSTIKNIVIHPEQYNKEDFPFDHPDAKLFVIKSYSEDDVHKSIKYNVWSSTPNGNRRLDAAYSDAQGRIPRECPIFLFFSVNTSGQFCGVAEMIGPVDFGKDMNFWQQDKWSGSFPVKWHLIKDVPNSTFRHIILENNENKPVTNSRDTQEIPYKSGINMLKLFKSSPMTTSILDDFPFYEGRQKAMVEQKRRHLGRSSDGLIYVPAFVAKSTFGVVVEPSKVVKGQFSGKGPHSGKTGGDSNVCEQPDKMNEVKDGMTTQVLKEDEVTLVDQPEHVKTDQDSSNARVDQQIENCSSSVSPENVGSKPACSSELVKVNGKGHTGSKAQPGINSSEPNSSSGRMDLPQEFGSHVPLDDLKSAAPGIVEGIESIQILKKPEKLSTNQVVKQAKGTVNEMEGITPTAVVKVGSMKIKVNMANLAGKLSSEIIGDEMCSVEPKGAEHVVQAISSKMS